MKTLANTQKLSVIYSVMCIYILYENRKKCYTMCVEGKMRRRRVYIVRYRLPDKTVVVVSLTITPRENLQLRDSSRLTV